MLERSFLYAFLEILNDAPHIGKQSYIFEFKIKLLNFNLFIKK